ncbi:hypothetical protein PG994_010523 [Apiospora phragmitis]|uniref:CENP-V/GFA domain-containing protein n=1 Tax=Apiospora phragmitis TaxID=2905665 RepID=A0ABR1TQ69_9PEZI
MAESTVELTAQCLCKQHTFKANIAQSSLPIKAVTCHCNSCRHMTGAMYSSDAPWPADDAGEEEVLNSTLQRYVFSERITVRFCGTCSSPMFWEWPGKSQDKISVFTGALANHTDPDVKDLVQFTDAMFVGDTLAGGAAPWLRKPNGAGGTKTRLWVGQMNESEELPHDWLPPTSLPGASKKSNLDQVALRCRCKGVDLVLQRWSPELENEGETSAASWIIDPDTHKGLGSFDACDSCRIASGVDVFNWTFALFRQLGFAGTKTTTTAATEGGFPASSTELTSALLAQERDSRFGTLACYNSSPGVYRYFCSQCSACVFYGGVAKPQLADVALGVLEAPDGARAEDFVSWNFGGDMVWRNDIAGTWREGLVQSIESEAEAWRVERGYPKNFYRVRKEKEKEKEKSTGS